MFVVGKTDFFFDDLVVQYDFFVDKTDSHLFVHGNLGVGTTNPTVKLDVNGNARFRLIRSLPSSGALRYTSDGTLTTSTSDIRMKTNIHTISNALDSVMGLRGVTFIWKNSPEMGNRIGVIAQEVEKVIPEIVFTNKVDGYKGVLYGEMTAVLIEALKQQQNMINKQQKIINQQQNINEMFEKSLKEQQMQINALLNK